MLASCSSDSADDAEKDTTVEKEQTTETEEKAPEFSEYDHHMEIRGLSFEQYEFLQKYGKREEGVFDKTRQTYVITSTEEVSGDDNGEILYNICIRFGKVDRETGKLADSETVCKYYKIFFESYIADLPGTDNSDGGYEIFENELLKYCLSVGNR